LADQNGNRVFELFPLLLQENSLRPRGIQKRLFLRDVQAGGYAAFMTGVYELQAFLQRLNGAIQNSDLGVELPYGEIIARQLRGDYQPLNFEIGGACLIGRLRGFNTSPPPPKQVDFVGHRKRQNIIGLRNRGYQLEIAVRRSVTGESLTLCAWGSRKGRELRRDLQGRGSARLFQVRRGKFDGLVRIQRLLFQRAQFIIMKRAPPFALGNTIFWSTLTPGFGDVPFCGHGRRGALILRTHGAAADECTNSKPDQGGKLPIAFHYCFLVPGAGLGGGAVGWPGG